MEQQTTGKIATFKVWHARTWRAGWIGKSKIIALWYFVIMFCAAILAGGNGKRASHVGSREYGVVVSTDIEHVMRKELNAAISGSRAEAQRALHDVYDLAKRKPQLQYVRVEFVMSKSGVSDKYGNPVKADMPMGNFEWDAKELAEARKYTAFSLWADDRTITLYGAMLNQMPSGHMLRDY